MSDYVQKENHGSLFVNDRKTAGSKQPDSKGDINIEGKLYWISAWREESKQGTKYLSLAVTPKDDPQASAAAPAAADPFDDSSDIPF